MKKITIILSILFVLASCGVEQTIDKSAVNTIEKSEVKKVQANTGESLVVDDLVDDKISFSDLEKNLKRLKNANISSEDLSMLNSQFISYLNSSVENEATTKSDANICDKADKDFVNNCKKAVFVKIGEVEKCDIFSEKYFKNDCKNQILNSQAMKKLDEKICEKLVFENEVVIEGENTNLEKQENPEIISCKNRVLTDKATKNLDLNICNKLTNPDKDMCAEMVKMEKENKKMEEDMKKQDELMKVEQEKNDEVINEKINIETNF